MKLSLIRVELTGLTAMASDSNPDEVLPITTRNQPEPGLSCSIIHIYIYIYTSKKKKTWGSGEKSERRQTIPMIIE